MNDSSSWAARAVSAALLIGVGLGVTGCSFLSDETMDLAANQYDPESNYVEPDWEAEGKAAGDEVMAQGRGPILPNGGWSCYFDVTLNDDWHDDIMCSNGSSYDRPYLRPDDDFVTEDEIWASAIEYEAALNGR